MACVFTKFNCGPAYLPKASISFIASLPDWMEFEMIELTEILSQLEGPKMSISLCFNYELRNDSRIKAFKDFMIKEAEIIN